MPPRERALPTVVSAAAGIAAIGGGVYGAMWPASQLFGRTLIAAANPDEIALTFDDGPNGDTTLRLLDILAASQVKATFFLVGKYCLAQPEVARRIAADGHTLGNHTMGHPRLLRLGVAATYQQIADGANAIADTTGVATRLFRPPFGGRWPHTLRIARELGHTTVMWNAVGKDWRLTYPAAIAGRVLGDIRLNRRENMASNVLLHDGSHKGLAADRNATLGAVERVLHAHKSNARFVTINEWL